MENPFNNDCMGYGNGYDKNGIGDISSHHLPTTNGGIRNELTKNYANPEENDLSHDIDIDTDGEDSEINPHLWVHALCDFHLYLAIYI